MKVTWKYAVQKQTRVSIPEIFSRQKCMGKGRRIIPAVAADLSFHLYMHKRTNKRQHR